MNFLSFNATDKEIRMASDAVLISSYSDAPFDYDEETYDAIAAELAERDLLEDIE